MAYGGTVRPTFLAFSLRRASPLGLCRKLKLPMRQPERSGASQGLILAMPVRLKTQYTEAFLSNFSFLCFSFPSRSE
jgi:hypothetical protein